MSGGGSRRACSGSLPPHAAKADAPATTRRRTTRQARADTQSSLVPIPEGGQRSGGYPGSWARGRKSRDSCAFSSPEARASSEAIWPRRCSARGDEVHVLDDLSTGSIDNIRHLKASPAFSYTIESAAPTAAVAELVDEADVVFHLAAAVGVELIVDSPVRTIETNVHCTEIVLAHGQQEEEAGLHRLHQRGLRQERRPALPRGRRPAARPDHHGPLVLRLLQGDRRVPGARLLEGARSADGDRPALQHRRARARPAATGWSCPPSSARRSPGSRSPSSATARQQRCFCHVKDVVGALAGLMDSDEARRRGLQHRQHRGDHDARARRAREAGRASPSSEIALVPYEEAYEAGFEDMRRRVPDTDKIGELLGWRPTRTLRRDTRGRDRVPESGPARGLGEAVDRAGVA